MTRAPLKIYLIAGEVSGDRLGADVIRQMKAEFGDDTQFFGIAGSLMQEQGMDSLFPLEDLSIMGVFEIAPRLNHILKRIKQTILNIEEINPDIVVSIDAPDFSFRVQRAVKARGKTGAKQVHYVAPTVWAWRPKRAKKIARFLDGIMCLFPFEPPYFEKEGLHAAFVGHPVVHSGLLSADGGAYRDHAGITTHEKTLGVFLGSRGGEIKRHGPVIVQALSVMQSQRPHEKIHVIAPTLPHLQDQVFHYLKSYGGAIHISVDPSMKWQAFKACDAAIAVSGTVGLELAVAGVPHLIAYRMNPLTVMVAKRLIVSKYAHLANIMMDAPIVPEFIQENCRADIIADTGMDLLFDHEAHAEQSAQLSAITDKITPPNMNAAAQFLKLILEK